MNTPNVLPEGPLIVGVDAGDRSRDAIALAKQLAVGFPGGLLAVYVHTLQELDLLVTGSPVEEVEAIVARDAEAKLQAASALAAELGVPDVQLRRDSSASAGLHEEAVARNAALVVLGSSNRSVLGRVLPGGTADRLLSGSPVPVAVAPHGYADRETACALIGVGFDGSPEARQAAEWAADLAKRTGASLQLIAIHSQLMFGSVVAGGAYGTKTVNQVMAEQLKSETEQLAASLSAEARVFRGDAGRAIVEHSEPLDMLVLGSRGYGPLRSVLLGSVSSYVMRHAACPVLVVPRAG
ncbi:MAG TPA: universal stress protein [Gemmatimonadales bacterium]|nr:universal stress protein [Gemmatimonadales bacterium]